MVNESELVALFEATHGYAWKNREGWVGPGPKYGVSEGQLDLANNNLRGRAPVPRVQICNVEFNDLEGLDLPETVVELRAAVNVIESIELPPRLVYVDLSRNRLSQVPWIPPSLEHCDLCQNRLKELPPHDLVTLLVADNQLECLASLFSARLRVLDASENMLCGQLDPPASLVELRLAHNRISGTLHRVLQLHMLQVLLVNDNCFEGSLPTLPLTLRDVNLANNNLQGALPPCIVDVKELRCFDVSGNPQFNRGGFYPRGIPDLLPCLEDFAGGDGPPSRNFARQRSFDKDRFRLSVDAMHSTLL